MPRIVPSQVVLYINGIKVQEMPNGMMNMNSVGSAVLSSILQLSDAIPDDLLTMDSGTYGSFITAKEQIREILKTWRDNRSAGQGMLTFNFHTFNNPFRTIRDVLTGCPDESPSPSTSELKFISDQELRSILRVDIGAVNLALSNGEWKAATVLAGSIIEALLLWRLQQIPHAEIVRISQIDPSLPSKPLEKWHLPQYIKAAKGLALFTDETITQCELARGFRNLIHPGRTQRVNQKCDRGSALSAVAGFEHLIRELSSAFKDL
jgi:hypothetical protein